MRKRGSDDVESEKGGREPVRERRAKRDGTTRARSVPQREKEGEGERERERASETRALITRKMENSETGRVKRNLHPVGD